MSNDLIFINDDGIECKDLMRSDNIITDFNAFLDDNIFSVYALTGAWGTGKTSFVKMWKNSFTSDTRKIIYIDAFSDDYETEHFIILIKAIRNAIKENNVDKSKKDVFYDKAKEIITKKNIAKLGINLIVDKLGINSVKDFIENAYNSCFDEITKEETLINELKSSMNEITKYFSSTVYIVVDELDRCRPDFALEMLERIKHIFNLKKIKFILVYNEKVMESIIHQKYGNEIDAKKYLDKYVQKIFNFNPNMDYLNTWFNHTVSEIFENIKSTLLQFLQNYQKAFLQISILYNFSFRDIQRILAHLSQFKNCGEDMRCAAITSIEILKKVNIEDFYKLVKYYKDTKKPFSENNEPEKTNFDSIYNQFSLISKGYLVSPNEALSDLMKYYEAKKLI